MQPELAELKARFEAELASNQLFLASPARFRSQRLEKALEYALSSPGKRLRPLLVLASAWAIKDHQSALKQAMPAAVAVEYIHTYSLIHDDLPAMDNDDYRRGRLSTHKRFDEGLAILAGDALLADAFYLVSQAKLNPHRQCQELALCAGRFGLTAGQAEDLASQASTSSEQWLLINQAKTARLFEACVVLGALSVGGSDRRQLAGYRLLGSLIGEAFQLQDDAKDHQGAARLMTTHTLKELSIVKRNQALSIIKQLGSPALLAAFVDTVLPG